MEPAGVVGRVLRVDLATGLSQTERLDGGTLRLFPGSSLLGTSAAPIDRGASRLGASAAIVVGVAA